MQINTIPPRGHFEAHFIKNVNSNDYAVFMMNSGVVKGYSGQLYRATTTYHIPLLIWG
jgi:hypothetical protein